MSYQRQLLSTLRTLLAHPTAVIHALIGPRQVGKTTIVHQIQDIIGFIPQPTAVSRWIQSG